LIVGTPTATLLAVCVDTNGSAVCSTTRITRPVDAPADRPSPPDVRALIRKLARENPLWGAPRIHGELLKLGVQVSQATVAKCLARRAHTALSAGRTFLATHVQQMVAADFFVVPTATYRLLFVLVLLAHERRRIVHVALTPQPTAAWTAQQFREAFPWDERGISCTTEISRFRP